MSLIVKPAVGLSKSIARPLISALPNRASRISNQPVTSYHLQTPSLHRNMTSILQSTASVAHKAHAAMASSAPITAGAAVPDVEIKINDLEDKINFSKLTGKNVLVLVPGAFSPTCSSQVPSYVDQFSAFKSKGVDDIYVVSVNDMFVMNAWKAKLLGEGKDGPIKFAADDAGSLSSALGLVLEGQAVFGGPRLKRGVIVIDNGKIVSVAVEPSPAQVTVSHADEVLKSL